VSEVLDPPSAEWDASAADAIVAGRRLRYVDIGGTAGPPLVLVHGTGGSWQSWLLNLSELSRGHRVVAVDLPGFGRSEPLAPTAGMADYADAVAALLAELGIERAIVVGHSLGGVVVMRMALRHPRLVAGVVNVDGGGVALTARRLRLVTSSLLVVNALLSREAVVRAITRRRRLRRWLARAAMYDRDVLTAELAGQILATFAAPGLVAAVAAGTRDDIADHADDVACPVLLLWGRHDRVIPVALAEALAGRMPSGRLEVIEEAGHCPMIERPREFNRAVDSFARSVNDR